MLTVVCKATFRLQPDESPLADEQDALNEEDNYWNDDRSRSVYSASDLAPYKPRVDVMLVGNAFAPHKKPVHALLARLFVGDIDKSIEVFGERTLTREGQIREGAPFAKMPLRYERAGGGPETANPVGVKPDAQAGRDGAILLPNLQPPELSIRPGEPIPPIGFGPIAPTWPERRAALGRHAGSWPQPSWTSQPIPEGVSPGYFNAAPADQQLDAIRETEFLLLENLHPEHPRLMTALPGVKPKALIERPGVAPEELRMTADTLWIDTDRSLCTLTWRAQVPLSHRAEAGRVVIAIERADASKAGPPAAPLEASGDPSQTLSLPMSPLRPTMPFVEGSSGESPLARFNPAILNAPVTSTGTVALPSEREQKRRGAEAPSGSGEADADAEVISVRDISPADEPAADGEWDPENWQKTGKIDPRALPTLPFARPIAAASRAGDLAQPQPQPPAPAQPPAPVPEAIPIPAMVRPQVTSDPIAPPVEKSPWAIGGARPAGTSLDAPPQGAPVISPALMTPSGGAPKAALAGVKAVSDAAALAEAHRPVDPSELATLPPPPPPEARPKQQRDVIKLVWFDPKSLPRTRKHPRFHVLLSELELRML